MTPSIMQLANQGNVQLVVSAADLAAFAKEVYQTGRKDAYEEANSKKEESAGITREEAAMRLKVSVRTIDAWRKDGVFGAVAAMGKDKVGGRVLIPKWRIDAMLS